MHAHKGLFTGQSENEAEGVDEAEGDRASGCNGVRVLERQIWVIWLAVCRASEAAGAV
jgi:hypothetical protein